MEKNKIRKIIVFALFLLYAFTLLYLMFIKDRGGILSGASLGEYITEMSNFVPFRTIGGYIKALWKGTMNRSIPIRNLVGNFVLFLPLAYFVYYFKKIKMKDFMILTVVVLLVLEMLQLFTRAGAFDVDDFILNLCGAILGYWFLSSRKERKMREG